MTVFNSRPARYLSLGTLDANESTSWWPVRDIMANDAGVITIVNDGTWGGSTVTLEIAADAAGTLGESSDETMTTTDRIIKGLPISPDAFIRLTMASRDTDDLNFYGF